MLFSKKKDTKHTETSVQDINELTYIDQAAMIRMRLSVNKLQLHSRKITAQQNSAKTPFRA